jgi:predicted nucleic-acid-binding Zn-ribbon protein
MRDQSLPGIPSFGKREKVQRKVFTVVECASCHAKTKQPFKVGDYVVKDAGKCEKCGGAQAIATIYAELPPEAKK